MSQTIFGAGGGGKGGGGGRDPKEADDNLNHVQYARIVDLLCEGEIEGIVDGRKGVFFDNVPLQNPDGSYNFDTTGLDTDFKTGDEDLVNSLKNADEVGSAVTSGGGLNLTVQKSQPREIAVTDTTVERIRVVLRWQTIQEFKNDGDIEGMRVQYKFSINNNGGGYSDYVGPGRSSATYTVDGRSADEYLRGHDIHLPSTNANGSGWLVRVTRITDDDDSAKKSSAFQIAQYNLIKTEKLAYYRSAVASIKISAEQFGSIPRRSYDIKGRKVRIPSNGTVQSNGAIIYSGTWNGNFKNAPAWTSDPAWCLYDLLTTEVGLGGHISESQLDKYSFFAASKYCSAQDERTGTQNNYGASGRHGVPDGRGGFEPRFQLNVNIQNRKQAYKLIQELCSVFRAMPYWGAGSLELTQDRPTDPVYAFNPANVTVEGFSYTGASLKNRPTAVLVEYFDMDQRTNAIESVELSPEEISRYGYVTKNVRAFGCTSRGQAARLGEWMLYSEKHEGRVVSFKAALDGGTYVRPGDIIEISDPVVSGVNSYARVSTGSTTTRVKIDNLAERSNYDSNNPQLTVLVAQNGKIERVTRGITGHSNNDSYVDVSPALPSAPQQGAPVIFSNTNVEPTTWRVLAVKETDGVEYEVSAVSYNASKFAHIERGRRLEERPATVLNQLAARPGALTLSEALYKFQAQVRAKITVSWGEAERASRYLVKWRKGQNNWSSRDSTTNDYELNNITPGQYTFRVYSYNGAGQLNTNFREGTITAAGKSAPPENVQNLTHTIDRGLGVSLAWDPVADLDLRHYEVRKGESWAGSTLVGRADTNQMVLGVLDADGTYLVKARDTTNNYSTNAASTTVDVTESTLANLTATISGNFVDLTWTESGGSYAPEFYRIKHGGSFAGGTRVADVKTTDAQIPIGWSGDREFHIAAFAPGVGKQSNVVSITVNNAAAPAPGNFTATYAGQSITLTWDAVQGTVLTDFYEVQKAGTTIAEVKSNSFGVNADFTSATQFKVRAVDQTGQAGAFATLSTSPTAPGAPTNLSFTLQKGRAQLSWSAVAGTLPTQEYRIFRGTESTTANFIGAVSGLAFLVDIVDGNSQTYRVHAVDVLGQQGPAATVDISPSAPSTPQISARVVDNNVLMFWQDCETTLPILHYEVHKGTTMPTNAADLNIGTKSGQFTSVFEQVGGTFTYLIRAVDTSGQKGAVGQVTAQVDQPAGYVLLLDYNSTFTSGSIPGTSATTTVALTRCPKIEGSLISNVKDETYEEHFVDNSFASPQAQIDAGYEKWLLPSANSGTYKETIDYGAVITGSQIRTTLTKNQIIGSTSTVTRIRTRKLTTDSWTNHGNVDSAYGQDFRFVEVLHTFTSAGNDDLLEIQGARVELALKQRTVSGTAICSGTDSGGTTVSIGASPAFLDVQSIMVTPTGTAARIAIYDYDDAAVPAATTFKVLLFDTSGNRQNGTVSWNVTGV